MFTQYDRDQILYWLKWFGGKKIEPLITDAFWEKASQYPLRDVYLAIRKASEEHEFTIEVITDLTTAGLGDSDLAMPYVGP